MTDRVAGSRFADKVKVHSFGARGNFRSPRGIPTSPTVARIDSVPRRTGTGGSTRGRDPNLPNGLPQRTPSTEATCPSGLTAPRFLAVFNHRTLISKASHQLCQIHRAGATKHTHKARHAGETDSPTRAVKHARPGSRQQQQSVSTPHPAARLVQCAQQSRRPLRSQRQTSSFVRLASSKPSSVSILPRFSDPAPPLNHPPVCWLA